MLTGLYAISLPGYANVRKYPLKNISVSSFNNYKRCMMMIVVDLSNWKIVTILQHRYDVNLTFKLGKKASLIGQNNTILYKFAEQL